MSTTKRKTAFIHTSPAAINPLMVFYSEAAPELEITNLLDDGILRLLSARNESQARERLSDMIQAAIKTYRVELAMVTCSSVSKEVIEELNAEFTLPILKIDYPMARRAVRSGRKVGVAATFEPTVIPTSKLLRHAAADDGTEIEIIAEVAPAAYDALLTGDAAKHDELLLQLIEKLAAGDVEAIVLAQVSMARILPLLKNRITVPVLSSLPTSLEAIRETLAESSLP